MKILSRVSDLIQLENHRAGITNCPFCDVKFPLDNEGWMKEELIREVIFNERDDIHFKPAYIIIASECPDCFETSWVHERVDSWNLIDITSKLTKRMQKEHENRTRNGKTLWSKSKCKTCKDLESVSFDNYYPFVSCRTGCGSAIISCNKYGKRNKTLPAPVERRREHERRND